MAYLPGPPRAPVTGVPSGGGPQSAAPAPNPLMQRLQEFLHARGNPLPGGFNFPQSHAPMGLPNTFEGIPNGPGGSYGVSGNIGGIHSFGGPPGSPIGGRGGFMEPGLEAIHPSDSPQHQFGGHIPASPLAPTRIGHYTREIQDDLPHLSREQRLVEALRGGPAGELARVLNAQHPSRTHELNTASQGGLLGQLARAAAGLR